MLDAEEFNEAVVQRLYDEGYDDVAELDAVASGKMSPERVARNQDMPMAEENIPNVAWAILYWAYREGILDDLPETLE